MPNELANWPEPCDLRMTEGGSCFCLEAFKNLYPAAWRYRLTISGAPAPYDAWNGIYFLDFRDKIDTPFFQAAWEFVVGDGRIARLYKWWQHPWFDPPEFDWGLELEDLTATPPYSFGNGQHVVDALPSDDLPPFSMSAHVPTWVDPLLVVPRRWDATA